MSYVHNSLSDGESVIGTATYHWTRYAWATWPLVTAAAIILALHSVYDAGAWLLLTIAAIGTALLFFQYVPLLATEIAVTNQRLIHKRGWLNRRVEELGLRAIEEINLSQSALGRLLGFGQIVAGGTGEGEIHLPPVGQPVDFRARIEEARRQAIYEDRD